VGLTQPSVGNPLLMALWQNRLRVSQNSLLALPRQRLASEADNLEAGDVSHSRTVGRPEEDPISTVSLSVEKLYTLAGIVPTGSVRWGDDVPSIQSGVYVVTIEDTLFGSKLPDHEHSFWLPDQTIVYIGRAKQLTRRLRQFRRHVYGKKSPHRGGQAILLLDCPKAITWAEVEDYGGAEAALINAFRAETGRMPFGNRVRSARISNG
jgi:hypothetical protein